MISNIRIELDWIALHCIGLDWIGLDQIGLDRIGMYLIRSYRLIGSYRKSLTESITCSYYFNIINIYYSVRSTTICSYNYVNNQLYKLH